MARATMGLKGAGMLAAGLLAAAPMAAAAQDARAPGGRAAAELEALAACRAITDPAQRLACYDAAAPRLVEAERAGTLVVADKTKVEEVRRGLFGFSLPRFGLFGEDRDRDDPRKAEEIDAIETTITSASQFAYGQWRFRLADGSTWVQVGERTIVRTPVNGTPIRIRKAALGSFLATVGNQGGIRVRREN